MNYIGSKYSLLPEIERVLDGGKVPTSGIALDLFAGTGTVSQFLKRRGNIVYANDWQYYSYLTCVAYVELDVPPTFSTLLNDKSWKQHILDCPLKYSLSMLNNSYDSAALILSYLDNIPGTFGLFFHTYCEDGYNGRLYFSKANGLRIQAIRDQIEEWYQEHLITPREKAWLIASLLEGTDKVANTASVYGAYLKQLKRSAQKPLVLPFPMPIGSVNETGQHRAFCKNAEHLLADITNIPLTLVYIDPPYNSRQYNANYHILETIARWDLEQISPRGVTGLRDSNENRSDYCRKNKAFSAFKKLISMVNSDYLLFSYNNEGLLSKPELEQIFNGICSSVWFEEIPYKRFRADCDRNNRIYKGDSTIEYLILGKLRSSIVSSFSLNNEIGSLSLA